VEKKEIINFPEEILEILGGTILGEVYQAIKTQNFIDFEVPLSEDDQVIGEMTSYEKALQKLISEDQTTIEGLLPGQNNLLVVNLRERKKIFKSLLYHSITKRLAEEIEKYPQLDAIAFRQNFKIVLNESFLKVILRGSCRVIYCLGC